MPVVRLTMEGGRSLRLSKQHFLPTCPTNGRRCAFGDRELRYAMSVGAGSYVWVTSEGGGGEGAGGLRLAREGGQGLISPAPAR